MNNSKILSIIAYYLSEFDKQAVEQLGYSNRSEAFKELSIIFNRENNYLKLRRDEFDALPDSKSSRNGWKNRKPANDVVELAKYLKEFDFEDITELVKSLIDNAQHTNKSDNVPVKNISHYDENIIENIINSRDENATIRYQNNVTRAVRVYNHGIISNLKKLYKGRCQICGGYPFDEYTYDICEAHHIEYFSKSMNNNSSNILIVCPNHHSLIHKLNPIFNIQNNGYDFPDGTIMKIKLNYHLSI